MSDPVFEENKPAGSQIKGYNEYDCRKLFRAPLIDICAEMCFFAQSHSADEEAWGPRKSAKLDNWMQHTSFVVACWIAQNTVLGSDGVDWEVVQNDLCGEVKDLDTWKQIITNLVDEFGGCKW
jgi:hypothetical protein